MASRIVAVRRIGNSPTHTDLPAYRTTSVNGDDLPGDVMCIPGQVQHAARDVGGLAVTGAAAWRTPLGEVHIDDAARAAYAKQLGEDVKKHVRDISERYIIPGETADSALMFLPSEAVYAELHAHHPAIVDASYKARVYIVSPTTMMATLTTVRAVLRDVEMRKQAGVIQTEVVRLLDDVGRLDDRVGRLR